MKKISFIVLNLLFFLNLSANSTTPNDIIPISASVIYGYNNTLVVAQVTNATRDKIAYAGFETSNEVDKGYWTYNVSDITGSTTNLARTGNRFYNLNTQSMTRPNLPAGRYIVSFWASGTVSLAASGLTIVRQTNGTALGNWTYYEKIISLSATATLTLSGNVSIDEVRLYPEDAQMVTTTYDPLIGKTSETDANNQTIYYEYDEFNRLRYVRDQAGNVIKRHTYHYKNQ